MFPWKSKQRFKFWMDREEEGGILEWKLFSFLLFTLKKKENIQMINVATGMRKKTLKEIADKQNFSFLAP